jgi:hypothetical protein
METIYRESIAFSNILRSVTSGKCLTSVDGLISISSMRPSQLCTLNRRYQSTVELVILDSSQSLASSTLLTRNMEVSLMDRHSATM